MNTHVFMSVGGKGKYINKMRSYIGNKSLNEGEFRKLDDVPNRRKEKYTLKLTRKVICMYYSTVAIFFLSNRYLKQGILARCISWLISFAMAT